MTTRVAEPPLSGTWVVLQPGASSHLRNRADETTAVDGEPRSPASV